MKCARYVCPILNELEISYRIFIQIPNIKYHGNESRGVERKILRRIYGPIQEGGRWRPRWNNELYTLYNDLNIVEE